jgi:hypothetical protein
VHSRLGLGEWVEKEAGEEATFTDSQIVMMTNQPLLDEQERE